MKRLSRLPRTRIAIARLLVNLAFVAIPEEFWRRHIIVFDAAKKLAAHSDELASKGELV